jgi:hypothetical protein
MRWAFTGLCVGLAALLAGREAHGSCIGPSGLVLWTYPADGAVDVPTNARLHVSSDGAGSPSLDGQQLPYSADGVFDLGQLAPNTTYQVTWASGLQAEGEGEGQSISFTTGAGPALAPAPSVPEPLAVTRDRSALPCRLVAPQGCFDTGQRTGVTFEPSTTPVAWLVESLYCNGSIHRMVWPGECGTPLVESEDARVCARLRATDGVHVSEATQVICSFPQLPRNISLATRSDCVGAEFPLRDALTLTSDEGVTCSSDDPAHCGAASAPPAGPAPLPTGAEASPTDIVTPAHSSGWCAFAPQPRADAHGALVGLAIAAWLAQLRRAHRRPLGAR